MTNKRINPKLYKTYNKFSKDHKKDILKEKTYFNYLGDTSALLSNVLAIDVSSIKTKKELKHILQENYNLIVLSLNSTAYNKTSDSWRKMRRALSITYKAAGLSKFSDQIRAIENPASISERSHNTNKNKRLTNISDNMLRDMLNNRLAKKDRESIDLIVLCKFLGIRPSEAKSLRLIENNGEIITIKIIGSKKTLIGERHKYQSRGLDRILTVSHNSTLQSAIDRAKDLDDSRIKAAQMRIHRASRKMYDMTDRHFCLYSLRYTFGSNLKRKLYGTEGGRIIAAAIMGHKNTSSISSYGHYRSGNTGIEIPKVDQDTLKLVQDDIGSRFGKAGKNFDVGEAIRNREYIKSEISLSL